MTDLLFCGFAVALAQRVVNLLRGESSCDVVDTPATLFHGCNPKPLVVSELPDITSRDKAAQHFDDVMAEYRNRAETEWNDAAILPLQAVCDAADADLTVHNTRSHAYLTVGAAT